MQNHLRGSIDVVSHLAADLRVAIRRIRQRPGYAALIVLALALGIRASSAMFSITKGVLLEPLPYSTPERLAFI